MDAARHLTALQELEPYEFEQYVADVWEVEGWDTEVQPETNDYGIDVIATRNNPVPQKALIQVKRHTGSTKVGGPDVQQYASLRQQEPAVDSVIIVSTNEFTDRARELAHKLNVKLVTGSELVGMTNLKPPNATTNETTTPSASTSSTIDPADRYQGPRYESRGFPASHGSWLTMLSAEQIVEGSRALLVLIIMSFVVYKVLQVLWPLL